MPDRMFRRQETQSVFLLWKDLGHELAEALFELAAAATGLAQDEPAAVDVIAQALLLLGSELRRLSAVNEQHGGLQQVFDRGRRRIDDLPGQVALPFLF